MTPKKSEQERILNFAVDQEIHKLLRVYSALENRTIRDIVESALKEYAKNHPLSFDSFVSLEERSAPPAPKKRKGKT